MIRALLLSLAQLGDRRVLWVLAKSLAVTLAVFALAGVGVWHATRAALAAFGWSGEAMAATFAVAIGLVALGFTFRAVAVAVVGVFADEVVAAVEGRHYPAALAGARPVGLVRGMAMGMRSALRFVGVNVALVPVYLLLLATGVGTPAAFFAVNGWLLGRDLGDMVAARHMDDAAMRGWRATTRARRFVLGLAGTALFVVPGVNLLAPVIGAAMATHVFHAKRQGDGRA